jgi:hypothetical protein
VRTRRCEIVLEVRRDAKLHVRLGHQREERNGSMQMIAQRAADIERFSVQFGCTSIIALAHRQPAGRNQTLNAGRQHRRRLVLCLGERQQLREHCSGLRIRPPHHPETGQ